MTKEKRMTEEKNDAMKIEISSWFSPARTQ